MPFEEIQTKRLILRKWTPETYQWLFENHLREEIYEILGLETDEEYVKEKNKYEKGYATFNRTLLFFQMILKEGYRTIGGCGFHNWLPEHQRAELGYALKKVADYNHGYMREALDFIVAYGFEKMDLHRIEAFVGPNNAASLKLIQSYGFRQEGHLKEHYFVGGRFEDSLVFGLLQKDFSGVE